ncbi:MAG: ribosome maturation factor RimP [Clostridiales Family XIII bacterium]|jgi:ribosome maturation factor RimP|nr:ribosome maturation factor RimP [Clostridiales Family XIII bacterium]
MSKKERVNTVRGILDELLPEMGYELWNVEYVKSGGDHELIVSIDKEGGIGTDDCEAVSKRLSARLDEMDSIETRYYLIVSSPGLDRPLLTDEHYARYTGSEVDVSLYKGVNGTKKLSGTLVGRTETELILRLADGELRLPRELVSRVRLKVII